MPALTKLERLTTANGSDLRQLQIQFNNAIADLVTANAAGSLDVVWAWQTGVTSGGLALGRGSTDTNIGSGAFKFAINGVPEAKAAVAAGTAIGAQTVAADTWAVYALDIATGGTITVTAGAGNTTSAYTTEALAIAGCPARVTAKARMGYITLKTKAATAFVAATDALAGGASGNPASTTNYYPFDGVFAATGTPTNCDNGNGTASGTTQYNGTRNGMVIPTALSRGSTDTNLATTACTYNTAGLSNIAKAAVAAGTALGALGTVPADTWAVIVALINSAGTLSFLSGASNYNGGYGSEQAAKNALNTISPTANTAMLGYITLKTKAATAFVVGTDALAGGSSGNPASQTNYYPTAGIALPTSGIGTTGITAAQIAKLNGSLVSSANY